MENRKLIVMQIQLSSGSFGLTLERIHVLLKSRKYILWPLNRVRTTHKTTSAPKSLLQKMAGIKAAVHSPQAMLEATREQK